MPGSTDYLPPRFLFNPHLETIYPALLRRISIPPYHRERIATPDDDFLDIDWLKNGSSRVAIISHGLEGNTERPYIKGMAKALFDAGMDVLTWNYRGCSEEMNRRLRFYHSGATDDLDCIVRHALQQGYTEISLVGFSLGGNITLKYLGEKQAFAEIKKAIVFSVPMDLATSCEKISKPSNWIYANRFLKSLKRKILIKASRIEGLSTEGLHRIKSLKQFDDRYTAPLHGFADANDYYQRCSSVHFVSSIAIPTLIINTSNDPFLSEGCFPRELLRNHPFVSLEVHARGGHVGFAQFNKKGLYWSEQRAVEFISVASS